MPAAAATMPSRFSTIFVRPTWATRRTDSSSIRLRRSASRSAGSVGEGTSRPSTLEITLDVTSSTSPSASHGAAAAIAAARSSPGRNSGSPVTGSTCSPAGAGASDARRHRTAETEADSADTGHLRAGRDHHRGGRRVGHQQRPGHHRSRPGTSAVSSSAIRKASSRPPSRPGAVVPADALGAAFHADGGQALVGVPADRGAADHRRNPDHRSRCRPAPRPGCRAPPGWCRSTPPGSTARSAPGRRRRSRPARPVAGADSSAPIGLIDRAGNAA